MSSQLKLVVIMSTFNGEHFLKQQLDSILEQSLASMVSLDLLIRDDGSTDDTVGIIKDYAGRNKNVHFANSTNSNNIGVKQSFFSLLHLVDEYDVVFFSDQDDVWPTNKAMSFVEAFQSRDSSLPIGVYSDLWISDRDANPTGITMGERRNWNQTDTNINFLALDYAVTGAAFAINQSAVKLVNQVPKNMVERVRMHDSFIALLIASRGQLVQITRPLLFYRQHEHNVIGAGKNDTFINKIRNSILNTNSLVDDDLLLNEFLNQTISRVTEFSVKPKIITNIYRFTHTSFFHPIKRIGYFRLISQVSTTRKKDRILSLSTLFFLKRK